MGKHVVVIGGGTAGCVAAGHLAREGFRVSLIEKENQTGGNINNWFQLFPDRRKGTEVTAFLEKELDHPLLEVSTGERISNIKNKNNRFHITTSKRELDYAEAILVATGFDLFDARRKEEYGYGIYDNVITSSDLEEMFHSAEIKTTAGHVPGRVGIVHCVGSRDEKVGNFHCSKVCCVTAVKQAIEIKEHLPETEVICFYMDMRMFGPYYEELYRESQEKWGVNFIRGKVSETSENIEGRLVIKAEDTLSGKPIRMEVDMLVLMVGMENSASGLALKEYVNIESGVNGFFKTSDNHYGTNLSSIKGLFYAGACTAPMNITDTIAHARSAAVEISEYLKKY
jgi:heterodisulfide reductase subunit A